ncbi:predicted signal transduction protein [Hahella chejuensis KCTC 2396]|uniref:Predicted signal transduction protein n=1 Tax=Hahella chejuensis (strain KCTC 2396) TaxID=349521 RepID=Q2S8R9_HAHCH|nr:HDOD domain-containing protein [Hahella chejuensis]ABC32955.1 predicted signal transduction protein [Hahella chejuensis KCTC 2396]
MAVPAAVARLLEDYSTQRSDLAEDAAKVREVTGKDAPTEARVRAIMLHDETGVLQAVIPESTILDLDRLNEGAGRNLRALPLAELDELRKRLQWYEVPALPDLTGCEAVIDARLSAFEEIYLPSSEEDKYLCMSRRLFEAAMGAVKSMQISVRLPEIAVNHNQPAKDMDQINKAISSFTSLRIQRRLEDTLEMPPLPETAQRIIKLRVDPEAGISELADIVETDPSLSAQVVSWASSSFYAAPGKIRSVHDAIVRVLGFDLVMNLSMGLALGRTLEVPEERGDGFTPYWEQSVWTATLCGALTTAIPKERRPEFGLAYLVGLLHNFGYLVLAHVFPPHFSLICRYSEANRHVDSENCEQYLLGITREQMGGKLMEMWNMPEEVCMALRYQKNPYYNGDYSVYSALLFVATQLLRKHGIGEGPAQPAPQSVWDYLGLTRERAEEVLQELLSMSEDMKSLADNLAEATRS